MVQHFTVNNHNGKYTGRLYHYDEATRTGHEVEVFLTVTTKDQHEIITGYQHKSVTEQTPRDFRFNKYGRLIADYGKYWGSELTGQVREISIAPMGLMWTTFYDENISRRPIGKFLTK